MFFPVLRGKQHELQALLAVAPLLLATRNVRPVVEPVRDRWAEIDAILDKGLRVGVVVNPQNGLYSVPGSRARRVRVPLPASARATFAHPNARPTFVAHLGTTIGQARTFLAQYGGRPHYVYVRRPPRDRTVVPLITAGPPGRLLIRRGYATPIPPRTRNVDIVTTYRRADANALYPADEVFSDRIVDIGADPDYSHFGDYSIEGATYRDGGGGRQTRNVALHLVYSTRGPGTQLRVRHYVSTTLPTIAAMCRAALALLVADVPRILRASRVNDTIALREMVSWYGAGGEYSLGEGKEMAMRHHLELMTVAQ